MDDDFLSLKEEKKANLFIKMLYSESIGMLAGYKNFDNLTKRLTLKDVNKKRPSKIMDIKHSELSEKILTVVKKEYEIKRIDKTDYKLFEPVIQSGGHYTLDDNCENDENYLSLDVILIYLKVEYKQYFSTLIRSVIFTPMINPELEKNYNFLVRVQEFIVDKLRDGVELGKVYKVAIDYVKKEKCSLLGHLAIDNFGSIMDIKLRDEDFIIKNDSKAIVKKDMVFNVNVGFNALFDPSLMKNPPHTYSLWIGDCVRVEKEGPATFLNRALFKAQDVILLEKIFDNKIIKTQDNTMEKFKLLEIQNEDGEDREDEKTTVVGNVCSVL